VKKIFIICNLHKNLADQRKGTGETQREGYKERCTEGFTGQPEGQRLFGRLGKKREDYIKLNLTHCVRMWNEFL
jgi:hypothetical protein